MENTDIDAPIPYRQNKHVLFGQQEGLCNGCKGDFPFNLQLLCSNCNRIKGDRPQDTSWRGWPKCGDNGAGVVDDEVHENHDLRG